MKMINGWVSFQKLLQQAVGHEIYSHALRSGFVLPSKSKTKQESETYFTQKWCNLSSMVVCCYFIISSRKACSCFKEHFKSDHTELFLGMHQLQFGGRIRCCECLLFKYFLSLFMSYMEAISTYFFFFPPFDADKNTSQPKHTVI